MSTEALLSIVALLVAVYTILPSERRLNLALQLGWPGLLLAASGLVAVHVIKYRNAIEAAGLPASFGPWRLGLNDDSGSYVILLAVVLALAILARFGRLSPRQVPALRDLIETLLLQRKVGEVIHLLSAHLDVIVRVSEQSAGFARLRKLLAPKKEPSVKTGPDGKLVFEVVVVPDTLVNRARDRLSSLLPERSVIQEAATDVVRRAWTSEYLTTELARRAPDLSLRMTAIQSHVREDYLNLLVRSWLDDKASPIYYEIQNNQFSSPGSRFLIKPENAILTFFLSDARRAESLGIYKPFGEDAIRHLDRLRLNPADDRYLKPLDEYYEEERWRCRLHTVIRFFEIMVLEALHQGVESHMWLYYFPHLTERIERNLANVSAEVDQDREWPTPYHYLLYEMISIHHEWIRAIEYVPEGQANIAIKDDGPNYENGSIAKSAILSMGACLETVLKSNSIRDRFKSYILEIALKLWDELQKRPKTSRAAEALANSILKGGYMDRGPTDAHFRRLKALIQGVDHIIWADMRGNGALARILPDRQP